MTSQDRYEPRQDNVHWVFFYNLKLLETMFIVQYFDTPSY